MTTNQTIINKLKDFRQQEKFTENVWNEMGMGSSSPEVSNAVEKLLNECADKLIIAINNNAVGNEYKSILKSYLRRFNKFDYDTEEKELICEYFYELSTITDVNFGFCLDEWLYGTFLATVNRIRSLLNPEKVADILKQPCTKCGVQLETYVMGYEKDIPSYSYFVVKCANCKEYNLLDLGPNLKGFKKGNYDFIEQLRKDEYTKEQALTRLDQITVFRKA